MKRARIVSLDDDGPDAAGEGPRRTTSSRKLWLSVGRSAGTKVLVLPISAVLGIINVRLIIDNFGLDAFAQYGLLVAIGNLLPFADLGISAAVMNVVGASADPHNDPKVHRVLVSSFRLLLISCSVLLLVTLVITVRGWWPELLGDAFDPVTGPLAAALCLAVIAVTLLVSPGQRVLAGLGKNHVPVGVLGLQSPLVLLSVILITSTDLPFGPYIAVIPYVALLLLQVVLLGMASRAISPTIREAVRDVPRVRTVRGAAVLDVAWPMLVWLLFTVIAMQSDRIILSHVSSGLALAEYNLAAQIFVPVLHVISAAGFALWPIFARQRAERSSVSPLPISLTFGAAAAVACTVLALATPLLARLASGGQIRIGLVTIVSFGVLMVFQSLKYPLNVYLTSPAGLRFQVYILLASLPVNLVLSYNLALHVGAAGPVIGSAVAIGAQYLACLAYANRQRRSAPPSVPVPVEVA